jgi:hypothetical protein
MAASEVIHSRFEAQPISHTRFSALVPPERVAPHLKTQRVLLLLVLPTDLVITHIYVCSPVMPMPIQTLTTSGWQQIGKTLRKV